MPLTRGAGSVGDGDDSGADEPGLANQEQWGGDDPEPDYLQPEYALSTSSMSSSPIQATKPGSSNGGRIRSITSDFSAQDDVPSPVPAVTDANPGINGLDFVSECTSSNGPVPNHSPGVALVPEGIKDDPTSGPVKANEKVSNEDRSETEE